MVMGSSHMKQTADIVICNFSKNGTILWNYVNCLLDIKEFLKNFTHKDTSSTT